LVVAEPGIGLAGRGPAAGTSIWRSGGCTKKDVAAVGHGLDRDWERMVAFYQFPEAHWKHLRTTNPVEPLFAAMRLRTAASRTVPEHPTIGPDTR
jgi:transposase-like protein